MRKPSLIAMAVIAAMPVRAQQQIQTYHAVAYSQQGSRFTLTIHRTGDRLKFDLDAVAGATSLSGIPRCQPVEIKPDTSWTTYCKGFQAQEPGQVLLTGHLDQLIARLDTVHRFGSAEFKLTRK